MTHVALLRGVNVGGRNRLPMAVFADCLAQLGCRNVRTYIQSGNAVFEGDVEADAVAAEIGRRCGFTPPAFVLPARSLAKAAAHCPFAEQAEAAPTSVHVYFLERAPAAEHVEALGALRRGGEDFAIAGKTLYLLSGKGFANSVLAERMDRVLRMKTTARNWRTIKALIAMTEDR